MSSRAIFVLSFAAVLAVQAAAVRLVHDGELTGPFVIADSQLNRSLPWSTEVAIHQGGTGYDGQFFLMLALDPWLHDRESAGLDNVRYRSRRILWPLLAWIVTPAAPYLRVWALFLWQAAFVAAGAWAVASWAVDSRRSALWGLLYTFGLGTVVCYWRMLGDTAMTSLLLLGLVASQRRQPTLSAALLGLAMLARETAGIATVVLLVAAVMRRDRRMVWSYGLAIAAAASWWLVVSSLAPSATDASPLVNFDLPFSGVAKALAIAMAAPKGLIEKGKDLFVLSTHVGAMGVSFGLLLRKPIAAVWRGTPVVPVAATYSALAMLLSISVWDELWAYSRVLLPVVVLPLLVFLATDESPTQDVQRPTTTSFRLAPMPAIASAAAGLLFLAFLFATRTR